MMLRLRRTVGAFVMLAAFSACSLPGATQPPAVANPLPTMLPTVLLDTLAPTVIQPSPTLAPPKRVPLPIVALNGVQLQNTLFGTTAQIEQVAASPPIPDTPPGDEFPAHVRIHFAGYDPVATAGLSRPIPTQINVYPTDEFAAYGFALELNALLDVFARRPDLNNIGQLPFVPPNGLEQAARARGRYLEFGGGRGIGYLVAFVGPDNQLVPDDLFYTFQGLSDDGKLYVAATFPVATNTLTEALELGPPGIADPNNTRFRLLERFNRRLNALDPLTDVQPPLSELEALIQRLTITPEARATQSDAPEIRIGVVNPQLEAAQRGATFTVIERMLTSGSPAQFRVAGIAEQAMIIELESPPEGVAMTIRGIRSNLALNEAGSTRWANTLPATDDYLITVSATTDAAVRLRVTRPQPLAFVRGSALAKLNGLLSGPDDSYSLVLAGKEGQRLQLRLEEPDIIFTATQLVSGLLIGRNAEGVRRWSGTLPADGFYLIRVRSDGGRSFTLEAQTEEPRPTPVPITPTLTP